MGLLALGALSGFGKGLERAGELAAKTLSEKYLLDERMKYETLRDERTEGYKIASEERGIRNIPRTSAAQAEAGLANAGTTVKTQGILSRGALENRKENLGLEGDIALTEAENKQNVEASVAPRQRVLDYEKQLAELESKLKLAPETEKVTLNAAKTETLAKIEQAKTLDADPAYKTAMDHLANVGQDKLKKLQIQEAAYKVAHQDEDHIEAIKTKKIAELAVIYKGSRDEVDRLELAKVKLETFKDPLADPDKQRQLQDQIKTLDDKIAREQSWVDATRNQIGALTGTKITPASATKSPVSESLRPMTEAEWKALSPELDKLPPSERALWLRSHGLHDRGKESSSPATPSRSEAPEREKGLLAAPQKNWAREIPTWLPKDQADRLFEMRKKADAVLASKDPKRQQTYESLMRAYRAELDAATK